MTKLVLIAAIGLFLSSVGFASDAEAKSSKVEEKSMFTQEYREKLENSNKERGVASESDLRWHEHQKLLRNADRSNRH